MTMRTLLLSTSLLFANAPVFAAIDPPPASKNDARIRTLVYDPNNPVMIYTQPGVSLRLEFGTDEEVADNGIVVSDQDTITPDPSAPPPVATVSTNPLASSNSNQQPPTCNANLCRAVAGNIVYIKPVRALDPQPLFIQMKRTLWGGKIEMVPYTFELLTRPTVDSDGKPIAPVWGVRFTYPERIKATQAAAWVARKKADDAAAHDLASLAHPILAAPGPKDNVRYGYRGSASVQPDKPWDNGRTTYLHFNGNRRLPNVYSQLPDGKESLAATTSEPDATGNTIRIAGTATKWFLRDGDEAGCLFDLGPDPEGRTSATVANRQ